MERAKVVASRRYGTLSPLRYPGGKAALAGLFADILANLRLTEPRYVEPYAGGAGAGIALLRNGLIDHLVINDLDPAVYAFWRSAVYQGDAFIDLVEATPLTISEWLRQREIYRSADESDPLSLGFSFFFLNRTNRSGVLRGGVIGGLKQTGKYKIDARFNRATLVERLRAIDKLSHRITVSNMDGRAVIRAHADDENTFMYIDPPYVRAGSQLYLNSFEHRDHTALAKIVNSASCAHWLMTYDTSDLIERLYAERFQRRYCLNYSARHPGRADELIVTSDSVAEIIADSEPTASAGT
ncbi:D12 class N6 adenine-specific DNA methyltransferase [Frankia canadensis]|uniref:site-specific DNA-methyltransferase (adenine-specific) n=1 Tax=Frankia canadensis TaxID=1836972 RepID=A0A2I2KY15_9ACTN|nr:DNA adenine methylase [Frankia canadensis]SNQ50549.1 D12 class N6 adenine-specific DNA methyltransferase [Frankia canadensis]SOU57839.1 D12 class N6 adenine-specific DNA methyltransferase [Frankia canadensis]